MVTFVANPIRSSSFYSFDFFSTCFRMLRFFSDRDVGDVPSASLAKDWKGAPSILMNDTFGATAFGDVL